MTKFKRTDNRFYCAVLEKHLGRDIRQTPQRP